MRPIYGCPENFRESLSTPTATFAEILMGIVPIDPMNVPTKFEVRSFTHSWDNSDCSFGLGCEPQSWEGEAVGVVDGTVRRALVSSSYRPSIVTFHLFYAFQRHCRFCVPVGTELWRSQALTPTSASIEGVFRILRRIVSKNRTTMWRESGFCNSLMDGHCLPFSDRKDCAGLVMLYAAVPPTVLDSTSTIN